MYEKPGGPRPFCPLLPTPIVIMLSLCVTADLGLLLMRGMISKQACRVINTEFKLGWMLIGYPYTMCKSFEIMIT